MNAPSPRNPAGTVAETLVTQDLFKGLAPRYIDVLAHAALPKEFAAGEQIFREGDPANRFYLILEGEVAVESRRRGGEPVRVQTIGANDVLGWSWLFPPYYWHFDARALTPVKAIFFYGTWLRESCETDTDFGYEMMKRMSSVIIRRLQAARMELIHAKEALRRE